jgi:hypothetical protein
LGLFVRGIFVAIAVAYVILKVAVAMSLPVALLFAAAFGLSLLFLTQLLTIDDVRLLLRWSKKRAQPVDPIDEKLHSQR